MWLYKLPFQKTYLNKSSCNRSQDSPLSSVVKMLSFCVGILLLGSAMAGGIRIERDVYLPGTGSPAPMELETCNGVKQRCEENYDGTETAKRDEVCQRQVDVCNCHVGHCEEDWTCFQRECFPIIERGTRHCDVENSICEKSCPATPLPDKCQKHCKKALKSCNVIKNCTK